MYETAFYKPHAMLAYYKVCRAPKERFKLELTKEFALRIDYICTAIECEEEAIAKGKTFDFNVEDFASIHSLCLAIGFYKDCKESVDYYRRKKSLEFAKVFEDLSTMTAKNAVEELNSLGIKYEDNRKAIKSIQANQEANQILKERL